MSDILIPKGAHIAATLFRPQRGAGDSATVGFLAGSPLRARTLAGELVNAERALLEGLPPLLHFGVPVCFVLTVILPGDGETIAVPLCLEMPRAFRREELGDQLFGQLDDLITKVYLQVGAALAAKAAA